jgi:hypothetical protein
MRGKKGYLQQIPLKSRRTFRNSLKINKLENLEEMDKFIDTNVLPKLKLKDLENLNRSTRSNSNNEIEAI